MPGTGSVAGVIATEELNTVAGVQVGLSGNSTALMTTSDDGHFIFSGLAEGFDYTITPLFEGNPLNGVSTFDLVLMSKHILGLQTLDSPYKIIAADVNNDRKVTAQDAIYARRLILNIDTKFPNNTSWRFIDASYQFPEPGNPWKEDFPEVININDLQGALANADFVAVKVSDLSIDAKANAMMAETRTKQGTFALNVADVSMKAGNEYRVEVTAADLAKLQGFQGTLNFDNSKVSLVDVEYGAATAANFGMHLVDAGMITTSWDGKAANNEVLFTMVLRATTDAALSNVLSINSRVTAAEAYSNDETMDLAIDFGAGVVVSTGFELGQNTPNPFRTQTTIMYTLPEAANVTFTVSDATGRTLKYVALQVQGQNTLTPQRNDLPAGVLFYTMTTGDFTATKSMVVE
ncbi:MAG: T9SS type A sorting domain-containing protein [Saprospiraceae bacterium]